MPNMEKVYKDCEKHTCMQYTDEMKCTASKDTS